MNVCAIQERKQSSSTFSVLLYKHQVKEKKKDRLYVNCNYVYPQPKFHNRDRLYHQPKKEPKMIVQTLLFTSALVLLLSWYTGQEFTRWWPCLPQVCSKKLCSGITPPLAWAARALSIVTFSITACIPSPSLVDVLTVKGERNHLSELQKQTHPCMRQNAQVCFGYKVHYAESWRWSSSS